MYKCCALFELICKCCHICKIENVVFCMVCLSLSLKRYCNFADIDECASTPCFHESKCIAKTIGYECECKPGYTGSSCESGKAAYPVEPF